MVRAIVVGLSALALSLPAEARKGGEPSWDCSIEVGEGSARWSVEDKPKPDWLSAHWAWRHAAGTHFMGFVSSYEAAGVESFRTQGFFSPELKTTVFVSPMRAVPAVGAWLTLKTGNEKIGPSFFGEQKYGRSAITVEGKDLARLFNVGPEIEMIVQDLEGRILFHDRIGAEELKAQAARLQVFHREMEQNRLSPAEKCFDQRDMIVLVH